MRIMVKRERFCEDDSKDGTRLLPDEVLVSILCLLSFKEATASSIVGRRWRNLHRWTRKLDLDGTETLWNLQRSKFGGSEEERIGYREEYEEEICKYIRWVESVVGRHKCSTLEEFRVIFNLHRSHTDLIDSWLRFAVSRKVEKLELNLAVAPGDSPYDKSYTFPYKNGSEFRFIRKLCTNFVNVSGEVVVSFLRNCPLLEHLSVSKSGDLSYLEIINTFPCFKRLEIDLCPNLESVVIRDSDLVMLKMDLAASRHKLQKHQFVVRNVPLLTEIWTYDDCLHFFSFSGVLPQIETLKLYVTRGEFLSGGGGGGVEMSNLKQFVVVDTGGKRNYFLPLINLIKASHGLQRFVLEAPHYSDRSNAVEEDIPIPIPIPIPRKMGGIMYPWLKEVKLDVNGYVSHQFEMVMHFVETGVALQNIVVDPRGVGYHDCGSRWDIIHHTTIDHKILEMARALQSILPSTVNLTIHPSLDNSG